jgi:hypothetical protein
MRPTPRPIATRVPGIVLGLIVALVPSTAATVAAQTVTYEYVYPYNTPDLIENHYLVLDASGPDPRGWYYGTSDEFDSAREGYLPGFFVAPLSYLEISAGAISFSLGRPERFFSAPVPPEYRSADAVPAGLLGEWAIPLPTASRTYGGTLTGDAIALDVPGGPRTFRRVQEP